MKNAEQLTIALVLSSVAEYQRKKELRAIAIREKRKRLATECRKAMEAEILWLKSSGYPETLGFSGDYIAQEIDQIHVPDDFIEAIDSFVNSDDDDFDDEDEEFDPDFNEDDEYDDTGDMLDIGFEDLEGW